MIGFVIPMPRSRRGRATVRTRSGRVVNQWVVAVVVWAVVLGMPALAAWWAHHHGFDSTGVTIAVGVAFGGLFVLVAVMAMTMLIASSIRQLRGREPRDPWFTTSWEHEDVDPDSWEIPKVW